MIERLRAFCRQEPITAALIALAAVASLAPIWIGHYLPLLDWPNHLSNVFVWRHLHDPEWNFEQYYAQNLQPVPYWLQYATVYLLSLPLGVEVAQKVFLSAALLALPASVAVYARRLGRDPRLALLAFPLAWNVNVAQGFLSFVAGIPLLLFALAALDRFAERPSWRWGLGAAALGASLYFMHILPWGLFLAVGGATALAAPRPWTPWRAIVGALPTLPALLIGLGCYRLEKSIKSAVNPWTPQGLAGFDGVYNDLAANLGTLPAWITNVIPCDFDERCFFLFGLLVVLIFATRPLVTETPAQTADVRDWRTWRLELGALVVLALYLALPRSMTRPFYWYAVNRRLAVVVAVFVVMMPRGPIAGVRRLLLWATAAVAIALPIDIAAHFHRFNVRARDYDVVMEPVPRGKQVLPLMLTLGDPDVNVNAFNQWGTYLQLREGGYLQFNFPLDFPLRYKRRLAEPPWDRIDSFRFDLHGDAWDYFLIHGPGPSSGKTDPFVGAHDKVRLLKSSGDWQIWEKIPKAALVR